MTQNSPRPMPASKWHSTTELKWPHKEERATRARSVTSQRRAPQLIKVSYSGKGTWSIRPSLFLILIPISTPRLSVCRLRTLLSLEPRHPGWLGHPILIHLDVIMRLWLNSLIGRNSLHLEKSFKNIIVYYYNITGTKTTYNMIRNSTRAILIQKLKLQVVQRAHNRNYGREVDIIQWLEKAFVVKHEVVNHDIIVKVKVRQGSSCFSAPIESKRASASAPSVNQFICKLIHKHELLLPQTLNNPSKF